MASLRGEGSGKGFIIQIDASSSSGAWRGSTGQMTSSVLTRTFQSSGLRLHFWERLKLQLGQVLSLGLVSWALAQVMPFWTWDFLLNRVFGETAALSPLLISCSPAPSATHHPPLPRDTQSVTHFLIVSSGRPCISPSTCIKLKFSLSAVGVGKLFPQKPRL